MTVGGIARRTLLVLLNVVILGSLLPTAVAQTSTRYSTSVDFNKGTYFNTSSADTADQLQLSKQKTTYPVMWIANAGEDSVSKIDTNTGDILAKYKTFWNGREHLGSAWSGAAPSRTGVDRDGNVIVANRHFDGRPPAVIKILATGGIDRNHDGMITTSTGATDVKSLTDTNANNILDIDDFTDERIAWVTLLPDGEAGMLGRSLTLDANGDVWVGTYSSHNYYKLSGADGHIIGGPLPYRRYELRRRDRRQGNPVGSISGKSVGAIGYE